MGTIRTIVQTATNAHNGSDGTTAQVHFGVAPTNGNLLVAIGTVWDINGAPAAATGWTIRAQAHASTSQMYFVVYSKYAGAGESTTQLPEANGRNLWEMACWEISGVSGAWATDFVAAHLQPDLAQAQSSPQTTSSFNTANNTELLLCQAAGNFAAATVLSQTGGGTTDSTTSAPDSTNCSIVAWHRLEPTSGTAITNAIAWSPTTANNVGAGYVELTSSGGIETSTASLGLSGIGFGAAASSNRAAGGLALTKASYGVTTVDEHAGQASLALNHVSFAAAVQAVVTGTGALALSGVAIHAGAIDLGAAGAGAVHFATFGA